MNKPTKDILQNIPLFNHLNDSELDLVATMSKIVTYPKNSILYYETEDTNDLLFLTDGLIKVYKVDKFDNEIFLYYIYPNSMISELSSLDANTIYCFSNAEFLEESKILSIDYKKFKDSFLKQNNLSMQLINELIIKNQQLQCIVNRELVFDATSKVAYMLNSDLEMFNKLKRNEAAFLLHIQPETLSRVLKRLQRNGTIEIIKGKVNILNNEEIQSIFRGIG